MVAVATSISTSGPPSNTRFLRPIRAHNPNGISIGLPVVAQMTAECRVSLYFTMGCPSPPKNCPFSRRDLDAHVIHDSLGPPESSTQTASRLVQPFLQGSLVWQTDRQTDRPTDHATQSVTIGRITYIVWAMRPNNNYKCGPMPNVMVALPNTGGALCSTPQSLADAY